MFHTKRKQTMELYTDLGGPLEIFLEMGNERVHMIGGPRKILRYTDLWQKHF